jgi:hypothetical protein
MTEKTKCRLLKVFGYTPNDLHAENADTAMSEMFEMNEDSDPMQLLTTFIEQCSEKEFKILKNIINEQV